MAADSKELQSQLAIQQSINKVLQDRQKVLEKQQKYLSSQVDTAVQLCKALECKGLDDVQAKMKEVSSGLQSAAQEAGTAGSKIGEMTGALQETEEANKKVIKSFSDLIASIKESHVAIAGFASGAAKGFKSAIADIKQMGAAVGTVVSGIFNIGKSIVAIPFSMFSGLVGMANNLAGSVSGLMTQIEEVRASFGDLASNEGAALMSGLSNLQSQSASLGGTGVSLAAVYGTGPDGVAAALADLQGIAEAMGASFGLLSDEFANNAGQLLAFKKGMGLSEEAMAGFGTLAISTGASLTDTLQDVGNYSIQMGEKFGVSSKLISKDMGDMIADFKTFGTYSVKEMATASTYARKLGIDMSALQSVAAGFDDFEGAADSVSMLNQAFGMQIDTMEMLNASDAERIDMLKSSFAETGKSFEDLTRQERALLAENAHMTEAQLAAAFSAENQGTSLEDIAAGADEAEDAQLSQTEVMNKLADTMDRVYSAGRELMGMWDALVKGITRGFSTNTEFKELLYQIRDAMKLVFEFGVKLGSMFASIMAEAGVFENLKELFNLDDLKAMFQGVIDIFEKFKDSITGKGEYSPQQMASDLADQFSKFFDAKSGPIGKLKELVEKGIRILGDMIAGLIPWIVEKMQSFLLGIADAIRNPPDLSGAASEGIGGALMDAFSKIGGALMDAVPVLLDALLEIIKAVFEKHGGKIIAVGAALLGFVLGKMIVLGAVNAIGAAVSAVVIKKLTDFMLGAVGDSADQAEASMPDPKQMEQMAEGVGKGLKSLIDQVAELSPTQIIKAGAKLALIALALFPAIAIFAYAVKEAATIMAQAPWDGIAKLFVMMLVVIPLLVLVGLAAKFLDPGSMATTALNMMLAAIAIGIGMIPFALALSEIYKLIGDIPFLQIVKIFAVMGLAILAVFIISKIGLSLAPPVTAPGLLFMALAAVLMIVGMVAFAFALKAVHAVLSPIPFLEIVEIFAMLGMAIMATVALALLGAAFAAAAVFFIPMMGGLILAAVMLTVGVYIFAKALDFVMSAAPKVGIKAIGEMFLIIGASMLALVALVAIGAGFALIATFAPIIITGMLAAAGFLIVGVLAFAAALVIAVAAFNAIGESKSILNMIEIIFKVVVAMAILAPLAAIFGLLNPVVMMILAVGLFNMSVFFVAASAAVAAMVAAADQIPMANPEEMKDKMAVIGGIAQALQALGGLALDAAKIGLAAEQLGKGGMEKVFNLMGGFLDKIKDTLVGTVETLVGLAVGYSKSDLEKAAVVGDLVAAIASFAAAVSTPLKTVSELASGWTTSATEAMNTVVSGMGRMMDMLALKLPLIVGALVRAGEGIPSGFKEKMESMKIMFEALGPLMTALADIQKIAEESVAGIDGPSVQTLFDGMAGGLSAIAGAIPSVVESLGALPGAEEISAKVDQLDSLFNSVAALTDVLGKFTELGNANSPSLTERGLAAVSNFLGMGGGPTPAAQAILSMVEEMNSINAALDGLPEINLNANLQKVADAFSVSESINVENKPVNITINLSVTMDANKVGSVLVDKSVMTTPLATAEGSA